jgi:hypothetical protein
MDAPKRRNGGRNMRETERILMREAKHQNAAVARYSSTFDCGPTIATAISMKKVVNRGITEGSLK